MNPPQDMHIVADEASRRAQARKIYGLLERYAAPLGTHWLDVGVGSGFMTSELARLVGPKAVVWGVDLQDVRLTSEGMRFKTYDGRTLPFDDGSFDHVISHHVLEHIREPRGQLDHLRQIERALRPGGSALLALPNRYRLLEAHHGLPFLSWPPAPIADRYMQLAGRGTHYDCRPHSDRSLRRLLQRTALSVQPLTADALDYFMQNHMGAALSALEPLIPRALRRAALPIIPSLFYLLRRR